MLTGITTSNASKEINYELYRCTATESSTSSSENKRINIINTTASNAAKCENKQSCKPTYANSCSSISDLNSLREHRITNVNDKVTVPKEGEQYLIKQSGAETSSSNSKRTTSKTQQYKGKDSFRQFLARTKKQTQEMSSKEDIIEEYVKDDYAKAASCEHLIRKRTGIIYDDKMTLHECPWDPNYPENPDRYRVVLQRCRQLGLIERCLELPYVCASMEQITKMHTEQLYEQLRLISAKTSLEEQEKDASDYDAIYFNKETFNAALLSAGCAISLVKAICEGVVQNGMAIIRPPGHHAMNDEYCGYCYFNNVAIAAQHALENNLASKILIVDFDVHHGQGTQRLFYNDNGVLYFSIHRYEHGSFWPNLRESNYDYIGEGNGVGFNINFPLNVTGLEDSDYLSIVNQILLPVAYEYQPDLILFSAGYDACIGCPEFQPDLIFFSAGFDAAVGDEKGEMKVTPGFYGHLVTLLSGLACGKVAVCLEGGYFLPSLAEGAAMTLKGLLGDPPATLLPITEPHCTVIETINNLKIVLHDYWDCFRVYPTYINLEDDCHLHRAVIKYEGKPENAPFLTRNCYPPQSKERIEKYSKIILELQNEYHHLGINQLVSCCYDKDMLLHKSDKHFHVETPHRLHETYSLYKQWGLDSRCVNLESWKDSMWRSMEAAGVKEKENALLQGNVHEDGIPWITVYVDGSWSKRSYGTNYSALSGMVGIVGKYTGELLYIAVRNKYCCICMRAANKQQQPGNHVCYKNWDESSPAMEADMVVEGFNSSETMHGLRYGKFVADGDSSVYVKIIEKVSYGRLVKKIECTNHALKNYGKHLRKIKADTHINLAGRKLLTGAIIVLLTKRAKCSIYEHAKNDGNVQLLKEDLHYGLHHVFGDHSKCRQDICNTVGDTTNSKITALKSTSMYHHLTGALTLLIRKAHLLIGNENNNRAERLMNIVARFNMGKRLNLVQRGSYQRRAYASALRYNKRFVWHSSPWKKVTGHSPGINFKRFMNVSTKKDIQSKARKRLYLETPDETKAQKKKMPVSKNIHYGPAAEQPVEEDEDILDDCQRVLNGLQVDVTERDRIALQSIGQFGNEVFESERQHRLTASLFGKVARRRDSTPCHNLVKSILIQSNFWSEATDYGTAKEPVAIALFQDKMQVIVQKTGLWVDLEYGFLAATPDGLIGNDALIEVKSLYSASKLNITTFEEALKHNKKTYLENVDGQIRLKRKHIYYYQPKIVDPTIVKRIHGEAYVNQIWKKKFEKLIEKNYGDMFFNEDTLTAIMKAAGCLLAVVDSVMKKETKSGVALIRPPGHHANKDHPSGYCYLNNVAVAAQYVLDTYQLERILIIDFDVHHGNGTQNIFYDNNKVLYLSIHRYENGKYFPCSTEGNFDCCGKDSGEGFNVNIPMNKERLSNIDYITIFYRIVLPIAYSYAPEVILVSAGFDAGIHDNLGNYLVTPECFGHFIQMLKPLANGKLILALEGGYNPTTVKYSMNICIKTLLGDPLPILDLTPSRITDNCFKTLDNIMMTQKIYWPAVYVDKKLSSKVSKIEGSKQLAKDNRGDSEVKSQTELPHQIQQLNIS